MIALVSAFGDIKAKCREDALIKRESQRVWVYNFNIERMSNFLFLMWKKKWKTLYSRKESWNLFAKRWSLSNQAYLHWIQRFCALGPDRPLVSYREKGLLAAAPDGDPGPGSEFTSTWSWAKLPIFLASVSTSVKWAEQYSCLAVTLWNCVKARGRSRGNHDLSPIFLLYFLPYPFFPSSIFWQRVGGRSSLVKTICAENYS